MQQAKKKLVLPPKSQTRTHERVFESGLAIQTDASLLVKETGGDVWLGGFALSRYLGQNEALVRGKSVLELGSGTGYLSCAIALLGAARVIATDFDFMIPMIRSNIKLNRALLASAAEGGSEMPVQACALNWEDPKGFDALNLPVQVVLRWRGGRLFLSGRLRRKKPSSLVATGSVVGGALARSVGGSSPQRKNEVISS